VSLSMIAELLKSRVTHVLLMLVGVCLFAYFIYEDNQLSRIALKYKSTSCVVRSSEVLVTETVQVSRYGYRRTTRVNFRPDITYTYDFGGKTYVSSVYRHGEQGMELEEANRVVSRYTAGDRNQCWVDPDEPEKAVLTRESDHRSLSYIALIALTTLLGGAAGWAFLEFVVHRPAKLFHAPGKNEPQPLEIPDWSDLKKIKTSESSKAR
jgi:hypothetical protein